MPSTHRCYGVSVEVRGQCLGISSLYPSWGIQALTLGGQSWWQAPVPADPCAGPVSYLYKLRS